MPSLSSSLYKDPSTLYSGTGAATTPTPTALSLSLSLSLSLEEEEESRMASQLIHMSATPLSSSPCPPSKLSKGANGSQSLAGLSLRSKALWVQKLEGSSRHLVIAPASKQASPAAFDLEGDSVQLGSSNGKQKTPASFAASDVATNDLCDANRPLVDGGDVRVLPPIFGVYGQRRKFSGAVVTLKVDDDNTSVWELAHTPGEGRVLVIDAGGQMRCALIGGILTEVAWYMGWAGVVVNGCIRDVDDINGIDIGVRALAVHPIKPKKRAPGLKHVALNIGGAIIQDGEMLYADSDGILISKSELDIQAAYEYKVDFEALHSIRNKVSNFPFIKKMEL